MFSPNERNPTPRLKGTTGRYRRRHPHGDFFHPAPGSSGPRYLVNAAPIRQCITFDFDVGFSGFSGLPPTAPHPPQPWQMRHLTPSQPDPWQLPQACTRKVPLQMQVLACFSLALNGQGTTRFSRAEVARTSLMLFMDIT